MTGRVNDDGFVLRDLEDGGLLSILSLSARGATVRPVLRLKDELGRVRRDPSVEVVVLPAAEQSSILGMIRLRWW